MNQYNAVTSAEMWIAKHKFSGKCIFVPRGGSYPQKDYDLVLEISANKVLELITKSAT